MWQGVLLGYFMEFHFRDETLQSLASQCRFATGRVIPGGQDRVFSVLRQEHQVRWRVKGEVPYDDQCRLDFERTRPDECAG